LDWGKVIFPPLEIEYSPNEDLREDIKADFREASTILTRSPRGAAALLRLCVQKLLDQLGRSEDTIDKAIAALVKEGLDPRIQKALDTVRVVGNESVHPGSMDMRDDLRTAESLFDLVNLIADRLISIPSGWTSSTKICRLRS
jgi:hypothetical protein